MDQGYDGNRLLVPLSRQDHIQGNPDAAVVLVVYGNYECRRCGEVNRIIRQLQQQLNTNVDGDRLSFVFRHFPNSETHPRSLRAAEAAESAEAQNQFWQMHHVLFEHQQALGDGELVEYANQLGLDIPRFLQEMSSRVHRNRVMQDAEGGKQSGVIDAPTLFLNNDRYLGSWIYEELLATILETERTRSI
jgi:protein-disulfide isomerase